MECKRKHNQHGTLKMFLKEENLDMEGFIWKSMLRRYTSRNLMELGLFVLEACHEGLRSSLSKHLVKLLAEHQEGEAPTRAKTEALEQYC
uniref:Uncharacterized protein n=1 Tax=Oryza barthii TaxID=65489 RepID=A0A0D3HS82_9ORYZ